MSDVGTAPPSAAPSGTSVAEEQRSGTATGSGNFVKLLIINMVFI